MATLGRVATVGRLIFDIAISAVGVVGCLLLGVAAVDVARKYVGKHVNVTA